MMAWKVTGVDGGRPSQISRYRKMHGKNTTKVKKMLTKKILIEEHEPKFQSKSVLHSTKTHRINAHYITANKYSKS